MAHTLYENFVLENKLTDLLNTKLNVRSLMTIDDSLTEEAGMKKVINTYSYNGQVEQVGNRQGCSQMGGASFTKKEYTVKTAQGRFDYSDEEAMQDPMVVDVCMNGQATVMVNDMNSQYFAELAKAELNHKYTTKFTYDAVVDAIALMNIEDESGLFLIIGNDLKATVRKDPDFKAAQMGEILFNGQIGTICGVPVIVSKLTPKDTAYLATKEAITLFVKKESEVEQERDANTRVNTVYMRKVNVMALTDATKVVKITKNAG